MIFLFSNDSGDLKADADFMRVKNFTTHPGIRDFYLTKQASPSHGDVKFLASNSQFQKGSCKLKQGEAAIIIAHSGNGNKLENDNYDDVTDAAGRLMAQIAEDNPDGGYHIFLAACGGAAPQLNAQASLLSTLIEKTQKLKAQLKLGSIKCWSYSVEAGRVDLDRGVPPNLMGTHICGVLVDGEEYHCGYDTSITTQLLLEGENYTTTSAPKPRILLQTVVDWYDNDKGKTKLEVKFKNLYDTLVPTA
jgi:hypothetical protein